MRLPFRIEYRYCKVMNAIKVYILLLLLVCSGVGIHAEQSVPFGFRHIGVSDGLPDNYVKNVLVLPDGRIAVRTSVLGRIS